jgi:hypothetical protein
VRRPALTLSLVLVASLASVLDAQAQRVPRVRGEEPTVGPSITPHVYRRVLLRARAQLQPCLQLPRGTRPYVVRFDLHAHPDGRLELLGAQIPSHATRPDSYACLSEVIASLRAPMPPGGGMLRLGIPLLFTKQR